MRVFAALPLPPDAVEALGTVGEALQRLCPGLKLAGSGGLHLTLHFFGELDDAEIRRVAGLWDDPELHGPALPVSFGGLGQFPQRGSARVVWVGFGKGAEGVVAYQRAFQGKLDGLGHRADARGFKAHITLARAGSPSPPPGLLDGLGAPRLDFDLGTCVLFQSILGSRGATYVPLRTLTFGREQG